MFTWWRKKLEEEEEATWCFSCTYRNSRLCVNTTICLDINYKSRLTYLCRFSKSILGTPVIASESRTASCCPDCQTIKVPFLLSEGAERKPDLLGLSCTTQQMEHLCTDDSYIVGNRTSRTPPAVTSVPNFIFFFLSLFLGLNCFFCACGWIGHKTEQCD